MLEEKYTTIEAFNRAWETTFASFAEVAEQGMPVKTHSGDRTAWARGVFAPKVFSDGAIFRPV